MRRNLIHLAVDIALCLAVLGLIWTGMLMAYILPPGSGNMSLWSMTRHEWGDIHYWLSIAMLALTLLHVILNWPWVCNLGARLCSRSATQSTAMQRLMWGLLVLVALSALVGGLLYLASADVTAGEGAGRHLGHSRVEQNQLQGASEATTAPLEGGEARHYRRRGM